MERHWQKLIVEHDDLFVLDADLTKSTKTIEAKNARPEHHFNMGIAEGNMMAVAAGMAASNKVVYASSFCDVCKQAELLNRFVIVFVIQT